MANSEEDQKKRSWQCPPYGGDKTTLHTWIIQQLNDGKEFFEASPGYQQLEESIRLLSGEPRPELAAKQQGDKYSTLRTARLKRNLREMVGSLSDIRFTPGYSSDSNDTQDQALLFNRLAASWYVDQFIDVKIKKGIQWMATTPCAWLEICYRTLPGERDKQEIDIIPHSAFDVVQTGIAESQDHQESYTVTIIKDPPVYQAHAWWPDHQDKLVPDRETPRGWFEKIRDKVRKVVSDVFTLPAANTATASNPTVRMYYTYVLDLSVNRTGHEIKMGYEKKEVMKDGKMVQEEYAPTWAYTVPFVGQMIPAGYDDKGVQVFRRAEPKDCRMFPGRRLIVSTEHHVIQDGPMYEWHGRVPLVKLCGDSWPWADFSMVHDVAPIQDTIGELERMAHQTARNRYRPSIKYNFRAVDRNKAKVLRTDVTGQRIGYNGTEGTGDNILSPLLPKEFYAIDGWYEKFMAEYLPNAMDYQMGVKDMSSMTKAKQGANPDTMEKMLEMAGPIVKSISRDLERSMRDIAEMFKFLVMQYYRSPKIMQIVGKDGMTPENFDFQPGNLVPSHLPGESKENGKPSQYSDRERAKYMADHVKFFITPNTMHEIVQTSQKLIYLQLWRGGFPIDPWTLADIFHIGDFGKKPEGANSIYERWVKWQEMQLRMKMAMAAEAQILMKELGLEQPGGGGGGGGGGPDNTPGTGPKGGPKQTGGRAPSGQKEPHITSDSTRGGRLRESK